MTDDPTATSGEPPADATATAAPGVATHPRPTTGTPPPALGDYELLGEVARGAMGVVYRARQLSLKRDVAVKMIRAGEFATPAEVQRFRAEAEAAANLDHPHILPVYEVGEHQGQHFFSMKLVEGGNLAARLGGKPAADARAFVGVLAKVCRAVHHGHQRGVLHRDVKPANILLDTDSSPYVADFGLAKKVESDAGATQTGAVLGTPAYMSPEQARGVRQLTTAADVYSLGAVLYEALAGRPPFRAGSVADTILAVLTQEPVDPRSLNPAADRDLSVIALKCLRKDPAGRYASAEALADDLDRWHKGEPITARPVGKAERARKWVRRNPAVAGLLVAVVGLLVAGTMVSTVAAIQLAHSRDTEAGLRKDEAAAREREKEARSREADERRKSERQLAARYVVEANRRLDDGDYSGALPWLVEALALDEPHDPDAARVHRLRIALTLRQCPRLVAHMPGPDDAVYLTVSPDGKFAAVVDQKGDWDLLDLANGRLVDRERPPGPKGTALVQFSGDGRRVLAWADDNAVLAGGPPVVAYSVPDLRPVGKPLPDGKIVSSLMGVCSPDGRRVLVTEGGQESAVVWDLDAGAAVGDPLPPGEVLAARLTADGGRAFIRDAGYRLVPDLRVPGESVDISTQVGGGPDFVGAAFTPNGATLVVGMAGGGLVLDARDGEPPLQTAGPIRFPKGVTSTAVALGGKTGFAQTTTDTVLAWDWSGEHISRLPQYEPFNRTFLGGWAAGSGFRQARLAAAAGPDGRRFAVLTAEGLARVYDPRTGSAVGPTLAHGGPVRAAAFAADGRQIITSGADRTVRVWDLATDQPGRPVLPLPRPSNAETSWSPDGTRVLVVDEWETLRDAATGKALWSRRVKDDSAGADPTWTDDGSVLLSSHGFTLVRPTGEAVALPGSGGPGTRSAAVNPAGTRLAVVGPGDEPDGPGRLWVYELPGGRPVGVPLDLPAGAGSSVYFAADGARGVAWSGLSAAIVFDADGGRVVELRPPEGTFLVVDPPARRAVIVGPAGGIVRDLKDGTEVRIPEVRPDLMSFSPDGSRLLTIVSRGARLWDPATGLPAGPPFAHPRALDTFDFSPDGRLVVLVGGGRVRLWDPAAGQAVGPPLPIDEASPAANVRFSPGGRALLVDGPTATAWDLTPDARPVGDLRRLAAVLASATFHPSAGGVVRAPTPAADVAAVLGRHPETSATPPAAAVAWHRATADGVWFVEGATPDAHAARFHYQAALAARPDDPDLMAGVGRATLALGDSTEAVKFFTRVLAKRPNDAAVLLLRAEAHQKAGRPNDQIADLTRAIDADPAGAARASGPLTARAEAHTALGRFREAAADWEKILRAGGPGDPLARAAEAGPGDEPWDKWAAARLAAGDRDGFRAVLRAVLEGKQWTDSLRPLVRLAAVDPGSLADWPAAAERTAKRRGELEPDEWLAVAASRLRAGQARDAIPVLHRLIDGDENDEWAEPALYLALAYHKLGLKADARGWRDEARSRITEHGPKGPGEGPVWLRKLLVDRLTKEVAEAIPD